MPEVAIVANPAAGAVIAADVIEQALHTRPQPVLGLATGSTPLGTWAELAHRGLDFRPVTGFSLDEYVGLPPGHRESYASVIRHEVVDRLGLNPTRVFTPGHGHGPLEGAGQRYETEIEAAGGIDVQILGIGRTGHIGFNEPGSSLFSRTRIKALAAQTRLDNARFFDSIDEVPTHCITQGLGTILDARALVLLAFGESKAAPVAAAVEGPLTSMCPGSVIQMHPNALVIVDEAAASRLELEDYYRFSWANRDIAAIFDV